MKRALAVLFVLALLVTAAPAICTAQQLPVPTTVAVFPGVTEVPYAGQVFIITTTVKLSAKFEWIGGNEIRIQVRTNLGSTGSSPMELAPGPVLKICWEGHDDCLFDGTPPPEWTGIVRTEGGFTEK
jgi:hypothetical protein